ncbi:hypothetical protein R3I93_016662 [Phoxinus phoxinus]|uniref:Ig-like domain-containing protein n=1 Tax=Phoxinus phoxinus TaxID=58324 RepID=A0AAN9CKH1_9TELE
MQITSSDVPEDEVTLFRVELNKDISLNCNMTDRYEIAWYNQNPDSGRLTLLMIAKMSSAAGRKLLVTYNLNRSRLKVDADAEITAVTLVITGVTESDSGLYFCGTKSVSSEMHFEKPIRLEMKDKLTDRQNKDKSVTELPKCEVKITEEPKDAVDVTEEPKDLTDEVTPTERVLMFAGVGLAVFVFFLTTVVAGGIIYHRGWQRGLKAAKHGALMDRRSAE